MNREEIRKQVINYVEEQVVKGVEKEKSKDDLVRFSTMSHNLFTLLPSVPEKEHWEIYKKIMRDKALSTNNDYFLTFDFQHILQNITKERLSPYLPCIIAAFHFCERSGYFFPIIRENINVALITGYTGEGLKKKIQEVNTEIQFTKQFYPQSTTKIELLSYQSKTLFLDMIQKIKGGYSIMWFQDWADKYVNEEECVEITFFGRKIFIPKGMGIFSFITKRPIIPWFAFYGKDMQPDCTIGSIIEFGDVTMEEYVHYATQTLYKELEKNVLRHYDVWEGWFNIHRFMGGNDIVPADGVIPELYSINKCKYNTDSSLFRIEDHEFVMNRRTGRLIEIDDRIFSILEYQQLDQLSDDELRILYRNRILVQ